jgi:hypothetical protein
MEALAVVELMDEPGYGREQATEPPLLAPEGSAHGSLSEYRYFRLFSTRQILVDDSNSTGDLRDNV